MNIKRALVVGGGITGLCVAIGLRRQGITVDIVEMKKEWTVCGTGIIQQCNVARAMAQFGLLQRYLSAGFAFDTVKVHAALGQLVATVPGPRLAGSEFPVNLGIARSALHRILIDYAIENGASVSLGTSVARFEETGPNIEVTLTNGTRKNYEVVIGADGIHSRTRAMLFPEAPRPAFTGQAGWGYNFRRSPEIDCLSTFDGGKYGSAGLCPLSQDEMYMFVTSEEPGNPPMPDDKLDVLMRRRLDGFSGIISKLCDQINDSSRVVYKPFEYLFLPAPWHRGRVILIGDAAHSMTPHLGQDTGMAIEDALVLCEEIRRNNGVRAAFDGFMRRRYERCKYVVEASAQAGQWEMAKDQTSDRIVHAKKMMEVTAQPI